jgi:hypothetical protein
MFAMSEAERYTLVVRARSSHHPRPWSWEICRDREPLPARLRKDDFKTEHTATAAGRVDRNPMRRFDCIWTRFAKCSSRGKPSPDTRHSVSSITRSPTSAFSSATGEMFSKRRRRRAGGGPDAKSAQRTISRALHSYDAIEIGRCAFPQRRRARLLGQYLQLCRGYSGRLTFDIGRIAERA